MVFSIQDLLFQWEAIGLFDFILPFMLIFSVVFAVLTTTNVFGNNKGVALVISVAIGLMSIRLEFVQLFFTELFPRFGIAIAVILVVVIMAAIFIPEQHRGGWFIGFGVAGTVFALIAVINSFNELGWFGSLWADYWGMVTGAILMIILIIAMFISKAPDITAPYPISFGPVWPHKNK